MAAKTLINSSLYISRNAADSLNGGLYFGSYCCSCSFLEEKQSFLRSHNANTELWILWGYIWRYSKHWHSFVVCGFFFHLQQKLKKNFKWCWKIKRLLHMCHWFCCIWNKYSGMFVMVVHQRNRGVRKTFKWWEQVIR